MSEYERFTTGVEDMEWITHQSSREFLNQLEMVFPFLLDKSHLD